MGLGGTEGPQHIPPRGSEAVPWYAHWDQVEVSLDEGKKVKTRAYPK